MAAVKFSVSVPEEILEQLDKIKSLEDRSRNWIINKLIEDYIEGYKEVPNNEI